jgi:hypothetical protein
MLPKRHRRSLTIGERQFFWRFTAGRDFDHRKPQLVVEAAGGGAVLVVRQSVWPEVTPGFVVAVVREALAAGWLAAEGTRPFVFARAAGTEGTSPTETKA